MIGESYYGNIGAATLNTNFAAADAPTDLAHAQLPANTEDNATEFKFDLRLPSRRVGTLEDGLSDDLYAPFWNSPGVINGNYAPGTVLMLMLSDQTADLAAGDRITFGPDPVARYVIQSITASELALEYGTIEQVTPGMIVSKLVRMAESPTTNRTLIINTSIGKIVNVRNADPDGETFTNWVYTVAAGWGEDRDRAIVEISEANRTWTKWRVTTPGAVIVKTAAGIALGANSFEASEDVSALLGPGDLICVGSESDKFYAVAGVVGTAVALATSVTESYQAGIAIFKSTDAAFTRYDTAPIGEFSAHWAFSFVTEASSLNLHYSETLQDQNTLGTKIEFLPTFSGLVVASTDGISTLTFVRTEPVFRGRKLYWAASVSDSGVTPNVGQADLNAWAISEPGQPMAGTIDDTNPADIVVGYCAITTGGMNPHFYDGMGGGGMVEYSLVAGFDIFATAVVPLTLTGGGGYFRAASSEVGLIVHNSLALGDFVKITNGVSRNMWVGYVTYPGQVEFSAANLVAGTNPTDYTLLSQTNFTVGRAPVNPATDSILPMTADPIPLKQYITEAVSTFHFTTADPLKDYVIVMQSFDTACDTGKG